MVTITTRARAGLAVLVRHPWVVLALWSAGWSLIHVAGRGWSWHFIAEGSTALFSSSGLDLYAQHPELQMGPLNFVLGAPFVLLLRGRPGEAAGLAFMLALGLLVVRELRARTGQRTVRSDQLWLGSSLLIMLVWTELAVHWGHLDDAMALLCTVVALRMVRSGHVLASAVWLGLAVDFKPWAIPFVALILIAPSRKWPLAALIWVAVVAAAWAPFVIAFPATLHLTEFTIPVDPASTLHLFGATDGTPAWCRYVQILGGTALAVFAVARGRWASTVLVVIALRMLFDPATKTYYEAGLVVGTAVFDIALAVSVYPIASLAAMLTVYLPAVVVPEEPTVRGLLRTAGLTALICVGLAIPRRPDRMPVIDAAIGGPALVPDIVGESSAGPPDG